MCKKVIIKNLMKDVLVFTCQFDWVKGIWECLWRCFWKVSVWIQKLSKEDLCYRCGLVSSNPLKVWIEPKAEETWFHSLVELDHPFSPSLWHLQMSESICLNYSTPLPHEISSAPLHTCFKLSSVALYKYHSQSRATKTESCFYVLCDKYKIFLAYFWMLFLCFIPLTSLTYST